MYFQISPTKKETLVLQEIKYLIAPLKLRRCAQILYEPYRTKILNAITSGKTSVSPESIVKIMAIIYKDYIMGYPYNPELFAAGYCIKKTLEDASPQELLPVWEYYSNSF